MQLAVSYNFIHTLDLSFFSFLSVLEDKISFLKV